jgi:hypothetical protein
MKRDLLAALFKAFDDEAAQILQPDAIHNEFCRIQPEPSPFDGKTKIIRKIFADYEDENNFEIPW